MIYKTKADYVDRLAFLRWLKDNAVTQEAVASIALEIKRLKGHNANEYGDVSQLVSTRYRCMYGNKV